MDGMTCLVTVWMFLGQIGSASPGMGPTTPAPGSVPRGAWDFGPAHRAPAPLEEILPAKSPPTASAAVAEPGTTLSRRRATPPEMMGEAIQLRPGSPLKGRAVTLLEALGRTADRGQQQEITRAYWRLAQAVAECNFRQEESERLQGLRAGPEDALALRNAQASAAAAFRTAEVAAVQAQHDLADKARLAPGDAAPLVADKPHIGPYRTRFDEMFASGNAPARTRLIDRTLPVRRRAIDVRATAIHAAEDALDAAADAHQGGRGGLALVLACQRQLAEQRQELLREVYEYNSDIAEYALAAAPAQASGQALVAMLILSGPSVDGTASPTPAPDFRRAAGPSDLGVRPAAFDEPLQPARPWSAPPAGRQEPTLAPPWDTPAKPEARQPTPAPSPTAPAPATPNKPDAREPTPAPARTMPLPGEMHDPFAPPTRIVVPSGPAGESAPDRNAIDPKPSTAPAKPADPGAGGPSGSGRPSGLGEPVGPLRTSRFDQPETRVVRKPDITAVSDSSPGTTALYSALTGLTPAVRAKQLALTLHWDRIPSKDGARGVTLEECLRSGRGDERRRVIEAYWTCRQQSAEYQVVSQEVQMLKELVPLVLNRHSQALGAESMLRLRAAWTAAEADVLDAEVRLLGRRYDLTERTGGPLDSPWLVPTTPPHSGPYQMKLEARPKALVESWPVRRSASIIPVLHEGLLDQASAVVAADGARTLATAEYRAGRRPIDGVLQAARQQRAETLAFLQTLSDYNQAIADYSLHVLPADLPSETLVGTLVVVK